MSPFIKNYSEKEICEGLAARDEKVLLYLFKKIFKISSDVYKRELKRYNDEEVRTITSDTLMVFKDKVITKKYTERDFKAYCAKIAYFKTWKMFKRKKELLDISDFENLIKVVPFEDILEFESKSGDEWNLVMKSWQQLSKECQELIKATDYCYDTEALSYNELSELSGKQPGAIRKQKFDCMKTLKKLVLNSNFNLN